MPLFNHTPHNIMNLSFLSFLILFVLGGTSVIAQDPICDHGKLVGYLKLDDIYLCKCDEGYVGSPYSSSDICFTSGNYAIGEYNIEDVVSPGHPCNISCHWEKGENWFSTLLECRPYPRELVCQEV
jgi:hypothetical protein